MSARVYFLKTVNGCNDVSLISLLDENNEVGHFYTVFVFCNFLVLLSTTVCIQNINKQIVNITDKNPTKSYGLQLSL